MNGGNFWGQRVPVPVFDLNNLTSLLSIIKKYKNSKTKFQFGSR